MHANDSLPASHYPVLIVGGGLAGLTTSLLLVWRGIRPLLVERHAATSLHPRARSVNFRSMELLRVTGIEEELYAAGGNSFADVAIIMAKSVAGEVFKTLFPRGDVNAQAKGFTPARLSGAGQDKVEPILARRALELGADVRFSTELVSWDQNSEGIGAIIRNCQTGTEHRVIADYLVAADGNRSPIRERLGIGIRGHGRVSSWITMVFESEEPLPTDGRGFSLYYLQNSHFAGVYATTDIPRRATVGVEYDPKTKSPADFTDAHCLELIRHALGVDLKIKILERQPWEMSSFVAERFISGRVFLAGDAAHTMPPTGGLGGQTAIQDGADMAWKLALVLKSQADTALLETYETERKAVAQLTVDCQTANYIERMRPDRSELKQNSPSIEYMGVALGYRYRSTGILLDVPDDGTPVTNPFDPGGLPGARAPHLVISRAGKLLSTIDLFGANFVLLAGPDGDAWMTAAASVAAKRGLPLDLYRLGEEIMDEEGEWSSRYGADRDGAVLIRPDGFVAWRSRSSVLNPANIFEAVLDQILGKASNTTTDTKS
jgi:putative polyketide hydroxylase